MDERSKLLTDVLYKEFQRIQSKSATTDEWFFRFLSIAIVPFLAFLAYVLANPSYHVFLTALPLLSLIGCVVVSQLMLAYTHVGAYTRYLEVRLNDLFQNDEMCNERFARAFYAGWWSPVRTSVTLGFFLVAVCNLAAIPVITETTHKLAKDYLRYSSILAFAFCHYWFGIICLLIVFLVWIALSWYKVPRKLRAVQLEQLDMVKRVT